MYQMVASVSSPWSTGGDASDQEVVMSAQLLRIYPSTTAYRCAPPQKAHNIRYCAI